MEGVKSWEAVATTGEIYSPRTGHAAVLYGSQIYVFAGIDDGERRQDLHVLGLTDNQWAEVRPKGSLPSSRSGVQATVLSDDIFFFGGYTKKDGEFFDDLYRFSPVEATFYSIQPISPRPKPRTDHTLVTYGTAIYAFAGFTGRERLNDLWEYSPGTNSWRLLECDTSPDPRFGHSAVVYRDRMLIFGGWNGHETLSDVWSFTFTHQKWSRFVTSGYIAQRYRHSAIMCGSSLFIFGGVNKDQVRFADVYEMNVGLRHWIRVETQGELPSPRTFHRAVLHEGFMYVFGGFDGVRRNDMYRLYLQDLSPEEDIESNPMATTKPPESEVFSWKLLLPQGAIYSKRTGHSAVSCSNYFYVFGGTDEINRRNDLYRYDVGIKAWSQIPALGDLPKARSGAKGQSYAGCLYFFGGYTKKDGEYFNDFYKFTISSMEWEKISEPGGPSPRTDHTMSLYEDALYIFAGYDGSEKFNDLYEYRLVDNQWRRVEAGGMLPINRFGHSATVCGRFLYVFGGWDGHDTLDDLHEYSFIGEKWRELTDVTGPKPSPRYRHTSVEYLSSLYIFAGVDKVQTRFSDLYRFNIPKKEWELVRVTGVVPSARTFHKALMCGDAMYVLGGFDGKRQNDMYVIQLDGTDKIKRQDSTFSRIADLDETAEQDETDLLDYYRRQVQILRDTMNEMGVRLQKETEKDVCRLCYERNIDTVVLECGHRVMCSRCSGNVRNCPVCRQDIVRVIKTYQ